MKILKTIGLHFNLHWKMVTFISIFWLLLMLTIFIIPTQLSFFAIGTGQATKVTIDGSSKTGTSYEFFSLNLIYEFLLKGSGLVFYSMILIIFINKTLLKEIHNNQISMWLLQPISRWKVFISKYLFIILIVSILYIPSYSIMLIVSTQAVDNKQLFANLALGGLQVYVFIILLATIFFTIAVALSHKHEMANVILSLITTYFLLIFALQLFQLISNSKSNALDNFIKYVGPQILLTNVFPFNLEIDVEEIIILTGNENTHFEYFPIAVDKINYTRYGVLLPIIIVSSALLSYLNIKMFNNKSFNL